MCRLVERPWRPWVEMWLQLPWVNFMLAHKCSNHTLGRDPVQLPRVTPINHLSQVTKVRKDACPRAVGFKPVRQPGKVALLIPARLTKAGKEVLLRALFMAPVVV